MKINYQFLKNGLMTLQPLMEKR